MPFAASLGEHTDVYIYDTCGEHVCVCACMRVCVYACTRVRVYACTRLVVVWFILHTESRYCIVVLVLSFVCYTCEIARNGKPCVVALNNFVLILFPFLVL